MVQKNLINPHGGRLINRVLPNKEKEKNLEQIEEFETVEIKSEYRIELKNIYIEMFSPQ